MKKNYFLLVLILVLLSICLLFIGWSKNNSKNLINIMPSNDVAGLTVFTIKNEDDVLRIISHGLKNNINKKSTDQFIYFLLNNKKTKEFFDDKRRKNKPVFIHLDACLVAKGVLAQQLSKKLSNLFLLDVYVIASENVLENILFFELNSFQDGFFNDRKSNKFILYKNGVEITTNNSYKELYIIMRTK